MIDVPTPATIEDLVTGLNIFSRAEIPSEKKSAMIVDYFKLYKNNDWQKFAFWDDFRYTRNLIEEIDGCYSLILMCWPEGSASRIHDHPNADCIMACLDGKIKYRIITSIKFELTSRETQFNWPEADDNKPVLLSKETFAVSGEVLHMNDSMGIHRVENPSSSDRAATLHFYFPCIHECLIFAEDSGRSTKVKMCYHSIKGVKQAPQNISRGAQCIS
ncbi:unnamed protein product [Oikopleura dioica]|uniref:Cysteine dioxygenase n=1 Tax=Oikopleura dioica TaxID=34765 RepID=E4Y6Q0_OIKDI|nr:unnamed protein product [Oikopleura dioica]